MRYKLFLVIWTVIVACSASLLLVGCQQSDADVWQGYVEADFVNVATSGSGRLERLHVMRGDQVTAGMVLYDLERINETAAYRLAQAEFETAEAQLADMLKGKRPQEISVVDSQLVQAQVEAERAAIQLARDEAQFKTGGISRQQLDDSGTAYKVSKARVKQLQAELMVSKLPGRDDQIEAQQAQVNAARAAMEQAKWRLDQTVAVAMQAGKIVDTLQQVGEWVATGRPVVRMLPPENIKVRFFVPQSNLGSMAVGQAVQVKCDGCTAPVLARISYISPEAEYTPPVIYSNETRSKLVFMIEARPEKADAENLHPGQPVSVASR